MKFALFALVASLTLVGANSLFAQTTSSAQPGTLHELETYADKILELSEQSRTLLTTTTYTIERLDAELSRLQAQYENHRNDLSKVRSLLRDAQGSGVVSVNGKEVTTETLAVLAKSTMKKISLSEPMSGYIKLVDECKVIQSDFKETELKAAQTAREFKTTMDAFRKKLPRELALFEFTSNKLKSQLRFAQQFGSGNTESLNLEFKKTTPMIELENIATELEESGQHEQAKKIRKQIEALSQPSKN